MPARNKVGTQLLVSPHIKARAQALALIRHESVAEIYRTALEGAGLPALESVHAVELDALEAALDAQKVDKVRALDAMTVQKLTYADLMLADGRPRVRFPGKI